MLGLYDYNNWAVCEVRVDDLNVSHAWSILNLADYETSWSIATIWRKLNECFVLHVDRHTSNTACYKFLLRNVRKFKIQKELQTIASKSLGFVNVSQFLCRGTTSLKTTQCRDTQLQCLLGTALREWRSNPGSRKNLGVEFRNTLTNCGICEVSAGRNAWIAMEILWKSDRTRIATEYSICTCTRTFHHCMNVTSTDTHYFQKHSPACFVSSPF